MRRGCDIPDHGDPEPGALEGSNGGLPAGAGAFDEHFNRFHPLVHSGARGRFAGPLGRERGSFAGSLETDCPAAAPGDYIPVGIGQRDQCVIGTGSLAFKKSIQIDVSITITVC